jgi:hypothetical protein
MTSISTANLQEEVPRKDSRCHVDLVHLEAVDVEAICGAELLVAGATLEVLGFLMLNKSAFVAKYAIAIETKDDGFFLLVLLLANHISELPSPDAQPLARSTCCSSDQKASFKSLAAGFSKGHRYQKGRRS